MSKEQLVEQAAAALVQKWNLHEPDARRMAADVLATLPEQGVVSEEWVLVPIEPTPEMLSAAHYELADKPFSNNAERSARAYAAMIDAALEARNG